MEGELSREGHKGVKEITGQGKELNKEGALTRV